MRTVRMCFSPLFRILFTESLIPKLKISVSPGTAAARQQGPCDITPVPQERNRSLPYAFFPRRNAFLFISRNFAGTFASRDFIQASSGRSK